MTAQRPILSMPRSSQTQLLDAIALAGLVATTLLAGHAWTTLPDTIPIHFGLDGRPNNWGSKNILWLLPSLGWFQYVVFTVLRRHPHTFNYAVPITEQNALQQYQIACSLLNWLKAEFAWLMFYTVWLMLRLANDSNDNSAIWFLPVLLVIIFGTIGFWLRQSFLAR